MNSPCPSPNRAAPLARAGRNLALKSSGEAVVRVCFFFLFVYAARVLGADDYGRFSWAVSLASLVLVGMELGLNPTVTREVARHPARLGELAGASLACQAWAGLALVSVLAGALFIFDMSPANRDLVLLSALVHAIWGLACGAMAGLSGAERMGAEAVAKGVSRLASLFMAGGLLMAGWGYWGLLGGLGPANLLALALALAALARLGRLRLWPGRRLIASLLKQSLPLALAGALTLLYTRQDLVMLQMLGRDYAELGWYSAAIRVLNGLGNLPILLAGSLLPVWASLPAGQRERLLEQALRLGFFLGFPAALGLGLLAGPICVFLFGPAYAPAGPALAWLAPAAGLTFLNHLLLTFLAACSRQKAVALLAGLCLLVNLGLNLWLIPLFGYLGAAAATSATEVVLTTACLAVAGKSLSFASLAAKAWPLALAGCLMGLFVWAVDAWPWWARAAAGPAVYAAALLAAPGGAWRELLQLKSLLKGKNREPGRFGD